MHIRKLLFLLAASLSLASLNAQDIHFSQYNMSPMTLNPANIGNFEGTLRIGGIYRGQWASVIGNKGAYKTPSLWVDAPIIQGFRKRDWVGVGLMFFSDKAGAGSLTHTAAKFGASYHLSLDKKGNAYLTLGAQYGQAARKLNTDGLRFEEGYANAGPNAPGGYDASQAVDFLNQKDAKSDWSDIDGGVVLRAKLNKRMNMSIGYSMYHIGKGKYGLVTGGAGGSSSDEIERRSVVTGLFNLKLTEKFSVGPSFIYQTMSGADEISLQALGTYLFDAQKDIDINFGLGYRLSGGDAVYPMIGGRWKNLRVGLAYDVNISDLNTVSNYRGGFEVAANYIVKIYKPAVVKTKVLCPRF